MINFRDDLSDTSAKSKSMVLSLTVCRPIHVYYDGIFTGESFGILARYISRISLGT